MAMENITIIEIAKMCGVSVSTVSRAMNNHPDINQETKDRVMQIIKEYHYVPNNSARNLKRSDARSIAVLIKGISNPFFSKMIKVFEQEIQKHKYSMVLQHIEENQDEVEVAVQLQKEKRLNGIVFLGGSFEHTRKKLKQITVPFVLSTTGMMKGVGFGDCSLVSVDDFKESYRMTEYLIEQGHKRIAIICADEKDRSIGKLRLSGYCAALEAHGIGVDESLFCRMKKDLNYYSMENGYAVTKELLDSGKEFTALYAISDSVAIGACRALWDGKKRIPEDYSVAGFDGLDIASYYQPSITTIRQPVEEMAEATIRILFQMIEKEIPYEKQVFKGELVIGESVRKIPE